jgi:hypothetical protein
MMVNGRNHSAMLAVVFIAGILLGNAYSGTVLFLAALVIGTIAILAFAVYGVVRVVQDG